MNRKKFTPSIHLQKDILIQSVLLGIYIAILLTGMYSHEMWRDELQAWSIARDSNNLKDLYNNLRYEGTPGLWHLTLFILSRFTRNPIVMQIAHAFIATLSVALILYKTKLPLGLKFLYSLGYFSVYEYGVISRNYALGLLFLIIIAIEMGQSKPNLYTIAFMCFLLSFTSVLGILISLSILCWIFLLTAFTQKGPIKGLKKMWKPAVVITMGIVISYATSLPPKDTALNKLFRSYADQKLFMESVSSIWASYIPIPIYRINFWNSNVVPHLYLTFRYSVVLFLFFTLCFLKKPKIAVFYVMGSFIILLFFYVKFSGALRHWGHLYIIYLMCLIMYYSEYKRQVKTPDQILHTIFLTVTTIIFIAQAVSGSTALKLDMVYQFSGGKNVAQYIKSCCKKHYLIADDQAYVSAVGFYLDEPTYSAKFKSEATFIKWVAETLINRENPEQVIQDAKRLQIEHPDTKILMVTSYFFDDSAPVKLLYTSGPSINTKRAINVYEVKNQ
ncbi:MAG: hypothetical protein KatS3mg101_0704 [Patescibacteria group bacterium]|nr:MAG: hypothetical protein KatS3mg101_0704 [Patescibacteria group bacterium]